MVTDSPFHIVVLAAGKGTRMKSSKAKVLHEVFFAPMLHHVLRATTPLGPTKSIVIVGHQREAVQESLKHFPVSFGVQEKQLGTGHAVLCAKPAVETMEGSTMILCGDTPLIRSETLQAMLDKHRKGNATLTLMTTELDDPTHYGRIISDNSGKIKAIVEEKDATTEQKKIREINAGIYCIQTKFLFDHLQKIGTDNSQGEVYLTDIVTLAVAEKQTVQKFNTTSAIDVLGVNARYELSLAHQHLQHRRNKKLMDAGVSMINPSTIQVAPDATIAGDVTLHPGVEIRGNSSIASNSHLETGAILDNVTVGSNCVIGPYCCLKDCTIEDDTILRAHSRI